MPDLRVGVIGAGLMGSDHVHRITTRIVGATVTGVVEPDIARATSAIEHAPGAKHYSSVESAIASGQIDAFLIATPGQFHESALIPIIAAGLPVLCEKPMTPDAPSSLRIVEAETTAGKQLVQIGFMRRFDAGYIALRELIASQKQGELLGLHCAHRNPAVPDTYHNDMLIFDSVVHEIDAVRFLTDSPITAVEVKYMKRNKLSPEKLNEPVLVLLETESGVLADVEMNVSVQFGYQVLTEAVFERGIAEIGRTSGMTTWSDSRYGGEEHVTFKTRIAAAYGSQIQCWVNAAKNATIDGPSAWDGYLAAAAVEAGLEAIRSGKRIEAIYAPKPNLYGN